MDRKPENQKFKSFTERFGDANPGEGFSSKLEEKILRLNEEGTGSANSVGISNFSFLFSMNKFLKVATPIFAMLLILGTVVVYQNRFWITSRYELWTLDQESVLSKLSGSAQDGSSFINSRLKAYATNGIAAEADMASAPLIAPIYFDGKSYTYSKDTITIGPAINKCATMKSYGVYTDKAVTFENHYYADYTVDSYLSYSKSVTQTSDGKIINYYLMNEGGSYTYFGGDYAIRVENIPYQTLGAEGERLVETESTTPQPLPAEDVVEPTLGVDDSDSNDAPVEDMPKPDDGLLNMGKVVDIVQIDGKEAYVVETSFDTNCDIDSRSADTLEFPMRGESVSESLTKIVSRVWYDKTNYMAIKTENYFGSYDQNNLISSVQSSYESSDKSLNEVRNLFAFDIDKRVITVKYPEFVYDPEAEKAELLAELKASEYIVLVPNLSEVQLTSMNIITESDYYDPLAEHYGNRNFYADGPEGTAMYNEFRSYIVDSRYNSVIDYSFRADTYNLNVSVYSGVTLEEAIGSFYGSTTDLEPGNIRIDGTIVPTRTNSESYGVSSGSSGSSREMEASPEKIESEHYYASHIFEYKGQVYVLSISDSTMVEDAIYEFKSYSSSTEYDYIKDLVEKANMFEIMPAEAFGVDPDLGYAE